MNDKSVKKLDGMKHKYLDVARLNLHLMKLPGIAAVNLSEKIKGYSLLVAKIIKQAKNDPFGINNIKNSFSATRLVLAGAIASISSGAALSIAAAASASGTSGMGNESGTVTREEAVAVAVELSELLQDMTNYEDEKIGENIFIDSNSNTYLELRELVFTSIQLIMDVTFSLPMRRTIVLDRDRQIIELCAELYGTTDTIDKFIIENNFNIDEIELLPMGKEVSYYVKSA
jgi:hypothetical protein